MFPNQRLESPPLSQKINQRRLNRNYSVRKKRDLASNTQNTYSDFYLAFCVCFFFTTNIQIKCPEKENNIIDKCDKEVWKCFILRSHDYRQWSAVAGIVLAAETAACHTFVCVCVVYRSHTLEADTWGLYMFYLLSVSCGPMCYSLDSSPPLSLLYLIPLFLLLSGNNSKYMTKAA